MKCLVPLAWFPIVNKLKGKVLVLSESLPHSLDQLFCIEKAYGLQYVQLLIHESETDDFLVCKTEKFDSQCFKILGLYSLYNIFFYALFVVEENVFG